MLRRLRLVDFKSFADEAVELAAHAPKLDAGQGRKWAMRDLGTRWKGLLAVCPELADLKNRIAGALGRA
jgi:hypothetical protein